LSKTVSRSDDEFVDLVLLAAVAKLRCAVKGCNSRRQRESTENGIGQSTGQKRNGAKWRKPAWPG
jgi:hypothetical protein